MRMDTIEKPLVFDCQVLLMLFNDEFDAEETELIGGMNEPFYKARSNTQEKHRLYFREDYYRSALHEISHWCIAGLKRRQLDDFGYWYEPEGRTQAQQYLFEQVEVKPQSIEKILCFACGHSFVVSADNLEADISGSQSFEQAVHKLSAQYLENPALMPNRAYRFYKRLKTHYELS
jgi:elongation factor P hydroxylase